MGRCAAVAEDLDLRRTSIPVARIPPKVRGSQKSPEATIAPAHVAFAAALVRNWVP
jgi:hypothetical protein